MQFWDTTLHELLAANRGYIKANKPPEDVSNKPMQRDEYEALKSKIETMQANKQKVA